MRVESVDQIFEQKNHHEQAIFCADWSKSGRLIATGSLDKTIKLLVCPDFYNQDNFVILSLFTDYYIDKAFVTQSKWKQWSRQKGLL